MFSAQTYISRRNELKKLVKTGIILFPGNNDSPMNYGDNTYKFRQDSSFLYYFGLDSQGLAGVIDVDNDKDTLFGNDREVDDVVWMGPEPPLSERALLAGVKSTEPFDKLEDFITSAENREIHFLPPYRGETTIFLSDLLKIPHGKVKESASQKLIKSVIIQRSIKTDEELSQIEDALEISYLMNVTAMKMTEPEMIERDVSGVVEGIALAKGNGISFPVIFSVRGETLHNHHHENIMKSGDLAVLDSGAESLLHYASDITRTFPVNGKFTSLQKDTYNAVLDAQLTAIDMMKPGITYKEVHLRAANVIAERLKAIGLMKGSTEDAVNVGAHALFFPHGLGHLLGLDVHDMEGLGETLSGYDEKISRSDQFGLAYLRYGKQLEPGLVLTSEPGVYFIPQLISNWKADNKFADYIDYEKAEQMIGFGGIRIEDDIVVTKNGHRVLGRKPIPKTIEEIETIMKR